MNKTGAEHPGRPRGCCALIHRCRTGVCQIQTAACRSGSRPARGSGRGEESCRRLSEARRQGELLSIKLLFYWLPNWPWNRRAEPRGFSSWAEEDLRVSGERISTQQQEHTQKTKQALLIFISVETKQKIQQKQFFFLLVTRLHPPFLLFITNLCSTCSESKHSSWGNFSLWSFWASHMIFISRWSSPGCLLDSFEVYFLD